MVELIMEQQEMEQKLYQYALKPTEFNFNQCKKVQLISNCYPIQNKQMTAIFQYHLQYEPPIENRNRKKEIAIISSLKEQIQKEIGKKYLSAGQIFYCTKMFGEATRRLENNEGQAVIFTYVNQVDVSSIYTKEQPQILQFLNQVIKQALRTQNYIELTVKNKFFDQKDARDVFNQNLIV